MGKFFFLFFFSVFELLDPILWSPDEEEMKSSVHLLTGKAPEGVWELASLHHF